MLGRTGAQHFQIRFCDEEVPTVWIASGCWGDYWETAAAIDPVTALFRLCDQVIDGGTCTHCGRPTGFVSDFDPMPAESWICWYKWDPELVTFRRNCEGVTK
jgi:hypothetical protein